MKKLVLIGLIGCLLLTSCATTINLEVVRPALKDMNGANSIEIGDFDIDEWSYGRRNRNEQLEITEYLINELNTKLRGSKYLELTYRNADIRLEGYIDSYHSFDEIKEEIKKIESDSKKVPKPVENGKAPAPVTGEKKAPAPKTQEEYITITTWRRNVSFALCYQVIDNRTGKVLFSEKEKINKSSSFENLQSHLPDSFSLVKSSLNKVIRQIIKEIQPYNEIKVIRLLDSKKFKTEFNEAKELTKSGRYEDAYQLYYSIYKYDDLFEAGYNAALLLEVMGELNQAEELMEEVYNVYNSSKAYKALEDIKKEIELYEKLDSQLEAQEGNY